MPVKTIEPNKLAALMEQKADLCLLDVRTPAEFQTIRAAGAKSLPLNDLQPKKFMAGAGNSTQPIYLICKSGGRSTKAAELFINEGFDNVVSVEGGTEAWASAGLPVERAGRNVLPLDRQVQTVAGLMILTGAAIGTFVNPWGWALSAFVGVGMTMAGLTGFCPMGILLAAMPWNQGGNCASGSCCSPKK